MARTPAAWRIAENVAAAIERSLTTVPGARVTPNVLVAERTGGVERQVDVLVEIPDGARTWRLAGEDRDRATRVDIDDMDGLVAKLGSLAVDRGCVVSRSGFTRAAEAKARAAGVEMRTMAAIEHPDWWQVQFFEFHAVQLERVATRLDFSEDQLEEATRLLEGCDATTVTVRHADGTIETLSALMDREGARAANDPRSVDIEDGGILELLLQSGEGVSLDPLRTAPVRIESGE